MELHDVATHAGELVWYQLNSFLFPIPSNTENSGSTEWKLTHRLRLFWRIIRPMSYYWLGDFGWHLFKLGFKRLFKKKKESSSD